ncbi:MAG: EAL and HDOD domain-containing protein [Thiohalomonadales bacterium]
MTDFYLARQPIYDKNTHVIGYELLHRSNATQTAVFKDTAQANTQRLISTLLDMGLHELVGDKLAFINVSRNYLLGESHIPLARKQVVLEVLEDVLPYEGLLFALRQFKLRNAYRIAFDEFEYDWSKIDMVPMADYIKFNMRTLTRQQIQDQLHEIENFKGKLIAVNVDDHDTFNFCRALRFDLFQGFYFSHPHLPCKDTQTSPRGLQILRLLAELQNPGLTYTKLQALVARDVTLTYRILRYINSAKFQLARPVESIQQSIALLGLPTITTWITILVLARIENKSDELMILALIRAKMCETLAKSGNYDATAGFTIGLLSTLDALLDKDISHITADLPLSREVNDALERRSGPLGLILGMAMAYEKADWDSQFIQSSKQSDQLTTAYFEAIAWAREVRTQLLKAV